MWSRRVLVAVLLVLFLAGPAPVAWGWAGGGCFTGDTRVLRGDGSSTCIADLRAGDCVLGFDASGRLKTTTVREIICCDAAEYFVIATDKTSSVCATAEHPFAVGPGVFKEVRRLRVGDAVLVHTADGLELATIREMRNVHGCVRVYNLHVDDPCTFFANNLAVHNKGGGGGGGGGGGSHGGGGFHGGSHSSSGGGSGESTIGPLIFIIFVIVFIVVWGLFAKRQQSGPFDHIYSKSDIAKKAEKTERLLEFIARTDAAFAPEALRRLVTDMFLALQQQWQARDYAPIRARMMPDLYQLHCKQIEGMIRSHEINVIDRLSVERVDIVHVRYMQNANQREFTVLITASGANYYVDDRDRSWRRGDRSPGPYQEFWTFQWQGGKFLLREIEQTAESSILKEEDFFEPFTEAATAEIAGAAGAAGPAGPAVTRAEQAKGDRIERLLNFLGQTDKLWNRQLMLERAREIFLQMHLAQEAGDPAKVPADLLFPDVAAWLAREIQRRRDEGIMIEFRNLCVRKADLVLVKNSPGRDEDEFVVHFTAHAQRILRAGQDVLGQDPDVCKFEGYWTFGRHEGQWKLKEILPPARGTAALAQENVDLEASPEQLQWFYRQKRAV